MRRGGGGEILGDPGNTAINDVPQLGRVNLAPLKVGRELSFRRGRVSRHAVPTILSVGCGIGVLSVSGVSPG